MVDVNSCWVAVRLEAIEPSNHLANVVYGRGNPIDQAIFRLGQQFIVSHWIAQIVIGIDDDRWVVVDFIAKEKLQKPVTLEDVKADERLGQMDLLRLSRLSVQSVTKDAFDIIISKSMEQ